MLPFCAVPPNARSVVELGGDTIRDFVRVHPDCICHSLPSDDAPLAFREKSIDCLLYHQQLLCDAPEPERLRLWAGRIASAGQMLIVLDKSLDEAARFRLLKAIENAGMLIDRLLPADRGREGGTLRAVPDFLPPRLLINTWLGDPRVSAPMRIHAPHTFAATMPGVETVAQTGNQIRLLGSDRFLHKIFILQRIRLGSTQRVLHTTEQIRRAGYLIIGEIDDHPQPWQEAYAAAGYADFLGCHALQTSTGELAKVLRQYHPRVLTFRNEIPLLPILEVRPPREAPVNIFFGAVNRRDDWREIMPALNDLLPTYGDAVRVCVVHDRAFFDALQTHSKEFIGSDYPQHYVPYNVYSEALCKADIALLPLRDTEFNRCKSDLKFIEAAAHGTTVLASPTVYAKTIIDGETGFLFHNAEEFCRRLEILIKQPERRYQMAKAAYAYVRSRRMLAQHYEERINAYRRLCQHLPELDNERAGRLQSLLSVEGNRNGTGF